MLGELPPRPDQPPVLLQTPPLGGDEHDDRHERDACDHQLANGQWHLRISVPLQVPDADSSTP